jgi:hypothetical protein
MSTSNATNTRASSQASPAGADTKRIPDPRLRRLVRDTLEHAQSFKQLPAEDQRKLAHNLAQVVDYLEDPYAGMGPEVAAAAEARALADPPGTIQDNSALRQRVAGGQKLVGKDFKAGGAREGAAVITDTVKKVDFVKFVSGLIDGVFNSIVNSSIKQMTAFASFLENVVKSVGEFTNDNVSQNQARDALVSKYPNALKLDGLDSGQPKIAMKDDVDSQDQPNFKQDLGVDGSLDDQEGEQAIVQAMRLQMGKQRQQLLSQILLMGLNRIIVTDGEIKASVLFDVQSTDTADRTNNASTFDDRTHRDAQHSSSFWGTDSSSNVNTQVSTANADEHEASTSKVEMHTKLSGSVLVKFKSDVFPLEKFATGDQMGALQTKSGSSSGQPGQ